MVPKLIRCCKCDFSVFLHPFSQVDYCILGLKLPPDTSMGDCYADGAKNTWFGKVSLSFILFDVGHLSSWPLGLTVIKPALLLSKLLPAAGGWALMKRTAREVESPSSRISEFLQLISFLPSFCF